MGEAVADVAELALLDILLDGVEELILGDLDCSAHVSTRLLTCYVMLNGMLNRRRQPFVLFC